jgi:hypothetical protein
VPHDRIARTLTLAADLEEIRLFDRQELIATHRRSWGKGQVVEDPGHLDELWRAKRRARLHRGQDRLLRAVPQAEALLVALGQRQRHLGSAVDRLLGFLDEHGPAELAVAVTEALAAGTPHLEAVRLILDRRRHERRQAPPLPVALPDDPRVRDLVVRPHDLADYDPEDPDE